MHEVEPKLTLYSIGTLALGTSAPCGMDQDAHNNIPSSFVYFPSGQSVHFLSWLSCIASNYSSKILALTKDIIISRE